MKIKPLNRNARVFRRAIKRLNALLQNFFAREKQKITKQVLRAYSEFVKESVISIDPRVQQILNAIDLEGFVLIYGDIEEILNQVTQTGVVQALVQIGMSEEGITEQMNSLALEYARTRGAEMVGKKWVDGELVDNPNPFWAISESTRDFLRADVATAVEEGWSSQRLADAIGENYAFSDSRSIMIARTEIGNAQVEGNMVAYRESGLVAGKQWIVGSEHDDDDECTANADAGIIPINESFPSGDDAPLAHPNCLLPDSLVSAGGVIASFKRWFEGEIVVLSIAGMDDISITPNHPVLTRHGWVEAINLKQGDNLVYCVSPGEFLAVAYPNDHQMPVLIQNIPGALVMAGGMSAPGMPVAPEDFHGDGIINSKVDIVWANRLLRDNADSDGIKDIEDKSLSARHLAGGIFNAESSAAKFLHAGLTPADGGMGSSSLRQSILRAFFAHFKDVGISHAPNGQSELVKPIAESAAMASNSLCDVAGGLSGHIRFVNLDNVSLRKYKGHVYNLHTVDNYYIAQNLIVHNCVCDVIPVLASQMEEAE